MACFILRRMTTLTGRSATLDTKAAAEYLGIAYATLVLWRREGHGPPYLRLGRLIRYPESDMDAWLDSMRKEPGDEG